jgi:hypothetical protein
MTDTVASNKQILKKRTMFFHAQASLGAVPFDLTLDTWGGPLDFIPDFWITKSITYISKNEANDNFNPVLVCDFGETNISIVGTFSAEGSIKQPNTYHRFIQRNANYTDVNFEVLLLDGQSIIQNNIINASTWLCQIEFGKYVEDPIFE